MVKFKKLMERNEAVREELRQFVEREVGYDTIELMIIVGFWYKCVNMQRRQEMKKKLEKWLKENEALTK